MSKKQETINNLPDAFISPVISTAAALLATNKVKLLKVTPDGFSNKKLIFITPREGAEKLYQELITGKLVINARLNSLWVEKLKDLIFRRNYQQAINKEQYDQSNI